jgi:hypothetical protein
MNPDHHLALLNEARTPYHWVIANYGMAALCVVAAGGAFTFGHAVAGLLVLLVSVALVVNADSHKKRGYALARESGSHE